MTDRAAATELHPFALDDRPERAHLRLISTTDIHGHIRAFDYAQERPDPNVGLARAATLIRLAEGEAGTSLLFDNGDYLQGNPIGDLAVEGRTGPWDVHPVIAAMNRLGYDAATLGNHEFDYGIDALEAVIGGANFPIVAANLVRGKGETPLEDDTYIPPFTILDRTLRMGDGTRKGIRIGVFGVLPSQTMAWNRRHLSGQLEFRDMVESARAWVPAIRGAGADIVVALAHTGLEAGPSFPHQEQAGLHLAEVAGIDALILGHMHLVFPSETFATLPVDGIRGRINGVPSVMAGLWGNRIGVVDLLLEAGSEWRVLDGAGETRPLDPVQGPMDGEADIIMATADAHKATLAFNAQVIGETAVPLESYFAPVAPSALLEVINNAQREFVEAHLGTDGDVPILSAASPFKFGGRSGASHYSDVPAGPITARQVADIYPFTNAIRAIEITGAELRDWLDYSAGFFLQVEAGRRDAPLLNPAFAVHDFDVIDGIRYKVVLDRSAVFHGLGHRISAGTRIVDLTCQGKPVQDSDRFIVATNSYRIGGTTPGATKGKVLLDLPTFSRDVVMHHIERVGLVSTGAGTVWSFAPMPGTSVVFESAARGKRYLDGLAAPVEFLGEVGAGFANYRLIL